MEVKQEVEQEESERPYSESLRVRTSQEESDYCLFCFGREKLKDMFEKNESTSIYSIMIGECFKKQIQKDSDDMKICETCIGELSGAHELKQRLDSFMIAVQSMDNVYVDNSTNEYSNLKLAIVTKNECLIDDDEDMETKGMSDCESEDSKSFVSMDFESDKNSKSCI